MRKKILYLECKTGAAGDMLMAALYSLLLEEDKKIFIEKMNAISDEITVEPEEVRMQGIGGIHMRVAVKGKEEDHALAEACGHTHPHVHEQEDAGCTHSHEHTQESKTTHSHAHHHTGYDVILKEIESRSLSSAVKQHAVEIYRIIGEAEAHVHRTDLKEIHFHEVGSKDAVADVVGCSLAIEMLGVDRIICSPVCVGNGTVRCAHGILPVPAPATAEIIKGMPVYTSSFDGELLTPTGAAVLKHFAQEFRKDVEMELIETGYGFGTRTFEQLSCVRAFLGYQC